MHMRQSIRQKIEALKAKAASNAATIIISKDGREVSNSLSKSIRSNKEAEAFKIAYKAAKIVAKTK